MVDSKGYIDVTSALKLKEAEGRVEVEKMQAESDAKFRELLIKESAKETASKHLAKFAGLYLLILVLAFIGSIKFIPSESIAVVAGLITLVVTNLSMILKNIVENGGQPADDEKKGSSA
tara:strand:+ start:63 stop:419 length:357 start_codon:yes stop_codon:yes gene_type:complete